MSFDEALVAGYVEFDTPADRLVLHGELLARFVEIVQRKTAMPFVAEDASSRLLNLRKKGLLPRLRRQRR